MIIKSADDRTSDVEALIALESRVDVSSATRRLIVKEIAGIRTGVKSENEAAYEINFYYGDLSKNWAVIHDLRIECDDRIAQVDHLLVNRMLEMWVCETKTFWGGVSINDHGEWSSGRQGRPSPIEQNRHHIEVLQRAFKTGLIQVPKRIGLKLEPKIHSVVLISKNSRITRPSKPVKGLESVIKCDQLRNFIDNHFEGLNNPMLLAKMLVGDQLREFAASIAAAHQPHSTDWLARFGLREIAEVPHPNSISTGEPTPDSSQGSVRCKTCGVGVEGKVVWFCRRYKERFQGQVYCRACQSAFP